MKSARATLDDYIWPTLRLQKMTTSLCRCTDHISHKVFKIKPLKMLFDPIFLQTWRKLIVNFTSCEQEKYQRRLLPVACADSETTDSYLGQS